MKVMNSTLGTILTALLLAPRAALRAAGRPKWGRTFLLRSTLRAVLRGLPDPFPVTLIVANPADRRWAKPETAA